MRFTAISAFALLSVFNKAHAETIDDILAQCRVDNLGVEDCKKRIEATGNYDDVKIITTQQRQITDETYYQVIVQVDYRGYVLGRAPNFDGKVYYPFEWRGSPDNGLGTRNVGPWECKGLTDLQCCGLIGKDVPDPDINGNYLECWLEESYYRDPVSNELFEVYLNPIDGSLNYLNGEQLIGIEANEATARSVLVSDIAGTLADTACPKATIATLHARILHALRGVQKARPFPKYTKNAVRQMIQAGVQNLDVTQDEGLQYALPQVQSLLTSVSKNGGIHNQSGGGKFIVLHLGDDQKVEAVAHYQDTNHPEADILVNCILENLDVYACADLLHGVKVVVVHPRSITDEYYNQVVVPVDYQGYALGAQPDFDGMVYYMFDWRGNEQYGLGTRHVGPWDCKGLNDVDCCAKIESDVSDPDINGKYIDCWLEDSYYTDPFTGSMTEVYYEPDTGIVKYATSDQVAVFDARDADVRAQLVADLDPFMNMTDCTQAQLWNMYDRIRHSVRGDPRAQGYPQTIRTAIRTMGDTIDIADNEVLQFVLSGVKTVLSTPKQNLKADGDFVVVVVDSDNTISKVSRFGIGANSNA